MGVVWLVLSVLFCASSVVFTKYYQTKAGNGVREGAVFMAGASGLILVIFLFICNFRMDFTPLGTGLGIAMGVLFVSITISQIVSYSLGNAAISTMFILLGGMLLPFLYGVIFLHESFTVWKGIGAAFVLAGILLQAPKKAKTDGAEPRSKARAGLFFGLCVFLFLANGSFNVLVKINQTSPSGMEAGQIIVLYCLVALVLSGLTAAGLTLKTRKQTRGSDVSENPSAQVGVQSSASFASLPKKIKWLTAGSVLCYALGNGFGQYCSFLSASVIAASIQFPVINAGMIVLTAILLALCFKVKIEGRNLLSLGASLAAILFFCL